MVKHYSRETIQSCDVVVRIILLLFVFLCVPSDEVCSRVELFYCFLVVSSSFAGGIENWRTLSTLDNRHSSTTTTLSKSNKILTVY
jgi:hypothetical protein